MLLFITTKMPLGIFHRPLNSVREGRDSCEPEEIITYTDLWVDCNKLGCHVSFYTFQGQKNIDCSRKSITKTIRIIFIMEKVLQLSLKSYWLFPLLFFVRGCFNVVLVDLQFIFKEKMRKSYLAFSLTIFIYKYLSINVMS